MKQDKILGIALAVVNVILIAVCAVFYIRADKEAPEFTFQAANVVYRDSMDETKLLEGITAYDANDGDVTERIVIEKMIRNEEDDSVVIFYAVSDRAGNVAKSSKEFPAIFTKVKQTEAEEEMKEQDATKLMEAGVAADLVQESNEEEAEAAESPSPVESENPTQSPSPSPSPEKTPEPTAEPAENPTKEPAAQQEAGREEAQPEQKAKNTESGAAPVLTLKVSSVQVSAGNPPAWVNLIGTLKDDKDNYETLFHNLSVSKYDVSKAGTYQVTVQTEDSDGNKSQAVPITIVVK